jgi:hypothetical protein
METTPFYRHVLAGALAGAFNDLVMHPVDTLRARINLNSGISKVSPLSAFVNSFHTTVQTQGPRGLYRGFSSVLVFSMPGNGIYFSVYERSKANLSADLGSYSEPVAGLIAQFAVSFLWTPYDIVKQRMQTKDLATLHMKGAPNANPASASASAMVPSSTLRSELRTLIRNGELFRGLVASWVVWAPFSVVYFGVFESFRRTMTNTFHFPADWKTDLISGSTAGIAGAVISQPADAVKTRLQVLSGDEFMANGFWKGARDIIRVEGHGALWRGVVARVFWLAPGTALTITAFEAMKGVGYN